ncbi:hypothetical protein HKX48_002459 [Thoreauomyces humboldtii]|nr:hypothetical protein HKX48_002459 [Thoreauomyces humboldtii]
MGFSVSSPVATSFLLVICLGVSLAATYLRDWFTVGYLGVQYGAGLFQQCGSWHGVTECMAYKSDGDDNFITSSSNTYRKSAAAMMVFTLIALVLATGGSLAASFGRKGRAILILVMTCTVLALLFEILTTALMVASAHASTGEFLVGTNNTPVNLNPKFGAAFALCIISWIGLLGVFVLEVVRRNSFMEKW